MGKYYQSFENDTTSARLCAQGRCRQPVPWLPRADARPDGARRFRRSSPAAMDTPLAKESYSNEFCLQSGCHSGAGVMPGATRVSSTADFSFDPAQRLPRACSSATPATACTTRASSPCARPATRLGAWEGEGGVPEGWTVQDLGYDGKTGAVPDGWTTPDLFEANGHPVTLADATCAPPRRLDASRGRFRIHGARTQARPGPSTWKPCATGALASRNGG